MVRVRYQPRSAPKTNKSPARSAYFLIPPLQTAEVHELSCFGRNVTTTPTSAHHQTRENVHCETKANGQNLREYTFVRIICRVDHSSNSPQPQQPWDPIRQRGS